jgi:chaperonin GroES
LSPGLQGEAQTDFPSTITLLEEDASVNLRPLHDRVIIKRVDDAEQKSAGGIIIPDSAKEKPQKAEVVAVGAGKRNEKGVVAPLDVKAGDHVLIGKYAGNEIKIEDQEYVIVREDEILAVIGDAKKKK